MEAGIISMDLIYDRLIVQNTNIMSVEIKSSKVIYILTFLRNRLVSRTLKAPIRVDKSIPPLE